MCPDDRQSGPPPGNPSSIQSDFEPATQALLRGQLGSAVQRFRGVLALAPNFVEARSNLGVALAALGNLDEAAAQYRSALALRPDLVDIYRNLGRIELVRGNAKEALSL